MREDQILHVLPRGVRGLLTGKRLKYESLQEIRLRTGKPLLLIYQGREMMLHNQRDRPYLVTEADMRETLEYISNYSLYAYEQEMKQGFITIEGGTCCVPSAVFNIEKTITNLKKLVIQQNTSGISENNVITINICNTGFISFIIVSILLSFIYYL